MNIGNQLKVNTYYVLSTLVEEFFDKYAWQHNVDPDDVALKVRLSRDLLDKFSDVIEFHGQTKDGITFKTRDIVKTAVDKGISWGLYRAHKHTDNPSKDQLTDHLTLEVMNSLCEVLQFHDDYED